MEREKIKNFVCFLSVKSKLGIVHRDIKRYVDNEVHHECVSSRCSCLVFVSWELYLHVFIIGRGVWTIVHPISSEPRINVE